MTVAALTRDGRRRRLDVAFTTVTSTAGAVPEAVAGSFAILLFAVTFRWFPAGGNASAMAYVLPVVALCIRPLAILTRIVRVETLNVLAQDYIRTARSKRLPIWLVYVRHALPSVMTTALTIGGLLFTSLIGGTAVVEVLFGINGVGSTLVNAVLGHDYPLVQGLIIVIGTMVVVVNALVDLALAAIDPRTMTADA
jgi:peptide/nickel transport system permease protein